MYVSLDEVIAFAKKPEILEYIAQLKKYPNIKLAIVLHRYYEFEQQFAKIFKDFETHFVKALTFEEVKLLITKPLKNTPIKFTAGAIQKIYEITGGRPMEINNICHYLFDPHHGRHESDDKKEYKIIYEESDIDNIIGRDTWELKDIFQSAVDNYRRVYSRSMSKEEKLVIGKLIKEKQIPIADIDQATIQPLIDTTFVKKTDGNYSINGSLFAKVVEEWVES